MLDNVLPTIFIGSSKEGLTIANEMARILGSTGKITVWTNLFDLNKSSFDNLTSQLSFFDYAVLIASTDDVTLSRGRKTMSPRDNVIFEYGLFTGGIGSSRTFLVLQESSKLPSDLLGITLPRIPLIQSPDFGIKLNESCELIKQHIESKEATFDLGFLPSTTLAFGYFSNFIERTVERLLEDKSEKKDFFLQNATRFNISDLKVTILIPNDLSDDMFKKVSAKRLRDGWQKLKVEPKSVRDYDFSIDVSKVDDGLLHLVDIPLTLNALNKSIELYSKKEHIGKTVKENLLEYREIRNFARTLQYLICRSALCNGIVDIEIVNI
ncbi:STING domain-containing protein [Sphingobacterium bambusae]|uniref:CD-NTase-associated protein 12 n=1 Tax=Sphingobacterium bambusae TaxID=662858 RepID=A0ABW6BJ30_9SPHI|nr:STING domain-containing protein [Sphingobacterium bambusae]WPL49500.1 STING domain-containing protein [Sphingobacterium bambusae]